MIGLVLAAGRGKRLNEYIGGENKCLYKVEGRPILHHVLENVSAMPNIKECIVVVGYKGNEVIDILPEEINGMKISYCRQEVQRGLIHAIECAAPYINDDFMLHLGDEYLLEPNHLEGFKEFSDKQYICHIGAIKVTDINLVKKTYSFTYNEEKLIELLEEKPERPFNNYMGTGNVFFKREALDYLDQIPVNPKRGEKELVDLFRCMIKDGKKVGFYNVAEEYVNLNTEEDILVLEALLV